jgi:hypothetical protein
MNVTVIGSGAVGRRVAETLAADAQVETVTVVHRGGSRQADHLQKKVASVPVTGRLRIRSMGLDEPPAVVVGAADVTVIATPAAVRRFASTALDSGSHVVCAVDDPIDVRHLLDLDGRARAAGRTVAIGTAMAPGLSCLLASYLVGRLDRADEIHIATFGTGGPACARQHHAALASIAVEWNGARWRRRAGGSGRELVWFPEPVGGADCYRGGLADPLLLAPVFPECRRITARLAATRRDRMTSWLPMMRRPHPEGRVGAVRAEVRGWIDERPESLILGAATPRAVTAAAVTAQTARWVVEGRLARTGAAGLAELVERPGAFLRELAGSGIAISAFEGSAA